MTGLLAALFLILPVLEVWVINIVQGQLESWPLTILILVLDSIVGAVLVRQEGTRAWRRFTSTLARGEIPTDQIAEGALILVGGALLLTPGFITDIVGLACVITPTRRVLARLLRSRIGPSLVTGPGVFGATLGGGGGGNPDNDDRGRRRSARGSGAARGSRRRPTPPPRRPGEPEVIDVEVVEVRRPDRPPKPDSDGDRPTDATG